MKSVRVIVSLLGVVLCASGCIGYVSGDLKNVRSDLRLPMCTNSPAEYQIIYKSDAKDDYSQQNIAGWVSSFSYELLPTYWSTTVHSEATILRDGKPVFSRKYKARIHTFYGLPWTFFLSTGSTNALQADEGGGLRVQWGIRDRTLAKVIADYGGETNQYCVLEEKK